MTELNFVKSRLGSGGVLQHVDHGMQISAFEDMIGAVRDLYDDDAR